MGEQPEDEPIRDSLVIASGNGTMTVRSGPWKLIDGLGSGGFSRPRRVEPSEGGPRGQLYNLGDDLGETQNLYQTNPQIVEELRNLLATVRSEGRSR